MAIFGGGGGGAGAGGGIENPRFKGGKKKESKSLDWEKGFRAGHTVGYARCELEFGRESTQRTFERGKEEGYKEGYEKAKSECDNKKCRIYIKYHGISKAPNWIIPGMFEKEDAIKTVQLLNKSTGAPEYTYEYEEI